MMRKASLLGALAMLLICFATACSGESDEAAIAPHQPSVDPRYATPEALVQTYNSYTTREPVDIRNALALFYAENDLQRRWIAGVQQMSPLAELDWLMFEKFGEGWVKARKQPMLAPDKPATMVKTDAQRAEATFVDSDGDTKRLMLVKIGDRWWVSGYTVEHDPDSDIQQELQQIDQFEQLSIAFSQVAPRIASQIRDGSIKSAADTRKAFAQAVVTVVAPQLPR